MCTAWTSSYISYAAGSTDREHEIVYSCNSYGKYQFDGTQVLLCSAIINPSEMVDDVVNREHRDPKANCCKNWAKNIAKKKEEAHGKVRIAKPAQAQ